MDKVKALKRIANLEKEIELLKSEVNNPEPKERRVKSWEELKKISGYYVDDASEILPIGTKPTSVHNMNIHPAKWQANKSRLTAQLEQLVDYYNGEPLLDWCDWTDENRKYCLDFDFNNTSRWSKCIWTNIPSFLSFKTAQIRDWFYKDHKDGILKEYAELYKK